VRRSLVRLIAGSVLVCWALGFVIIAAYARSRSWDEARARRDGVFLVHQLLDGEPAPARAEHLGRLQQHFLVPFTIVGMDDVERRVGRRPARGEAIHFEVSRSEHWYFVIFADGTGALAAGPVHPALPPGVLPIGALVSVALLPLIAALIALRVERGLAKVERASQKLATGELSARVENPDGPSSELATSFNEMAARVERLIRSRDELVQAVSHELGSPLSRIRFHLELLADKSGRARQERIDAMTRDLDALDELVAELLRYVQSDEMELERREIDPGRSLPDLVELAKLEAPQGKTVEIELSVSRAAPIVADPRLFQRTVENLLRNAVRHARGKVRLDVSAAADVTTVAVHDDGPGIPEELREKVLVPFFRPQADRSRKTGGIGLGLAIVNRVVQRHGGRIEIGTSPLGGASITTSWPKT
jgi:signal transduction histidine kinase